MTLEAVAGDGRPGGHGENWRQLITERQTLAQVAFLKFGLSPGSTDP